MLNKLAIAATCSLFCKVLLLNRLMTLIFARLVAYLYFLL
jgi:hypothetical protein